MHEHPRTRQKLPEYHTVERSAHLELDAGEIITNEALKHLRSQRRVVIFKKGG